MLMVDVVVDIVLFKDTEDAMIGEDLEGDSENDCSAEEEEHCPSAEPCTDVLDELELREVGILKRLAKKCSDPEQLREKTRKLSRTMDPVIKNVQKVDQRD